MGTLNQSKVKDKYTASDIEYSSPTMTGQSGRVSDGYTLHYTPRGVGGKSADGEASRKMNQQEIRDYQKQVDKTTFMQSKQATAQRKKDAEEAPLREAEAAAAEQRAALDRARAEAEKARQHSDAMSNQAKAQGAVSGMTQEGASNKPHTSSELSSSSVDGTSVEKRNQRPRNKLTAYLGV